MARKQHNEVKAGLFTILALALLLGLVLWLGAADVFSPKAGEVYFFAPISAGKLGLVKGASVNVNDVEVAKITRIEYLPDRAGTLYVANLLNADYHISTDAKAEVDGPVIGVPNIVVKFLGSNAGEKSTRKNPISISAGGIMGAMAKLSEDKPGSLLYKINTIAVKIINVADNFESISSAILTQVQADESESLMSKLHLSLSDINALTSIILGQANPDISTSLLGKVHLALDDLNKTIASLRVETDPAKKISLLAKIHTSINDINAMTKSARPAVDKFTTSIVSSAETIEAYITGDVGTILRNARRISDQTLQLVVNFNKVSKRIKDIVALNHDNIDEMIDNMKLVSDNLKATSTEIRRHPWKLLHSPSESESRSQNIYDAARAFSQGAEQLDQAMAKLKRLAEENPKGIDANDENLKKIRQHLLDVFGRFHKAEQSLWEELKQ